MAPERPFRVVGVGVRIAELAGAVDHQGDAVVAPGDVLGIADLPQDDDVLAVDPGEALGLVDHLQVGLAVAAPEEAMERAVGAVLAEVLEHRLQGGAHRAPDVDHETCRNRREPGGTKGSACRCGQVR